MNLTGSESNVVTIVRRYRAADFRDDDEPRPGELDALRRWCIELRELSPGERQE